MENLLLESQLRELNSRENLTRFELLNEYQQLFTRMRIIPASERLYDKLIKSGVLKIDSLEDIRRTYNWYREELYGYVSFNANALREELQHTWWVFATRDMPKAIDQGLVRDVAREWNMGTDVHIYFNKKGCYPQVRSALGLPPSRCESRHSQTL